MYFLSSSRPSVAAWTPENNVPLENEHISTSETISASVKIQGAWGRYFFNHLIQNPTYHLHHSLITGNSAVINYARQAVKSNCVCAQSVCMYFVVLFCICVCTKNRNRKRESYIYILVHFIPEKKTRLSVRCTTCFWRTVGDQPFNCLCECCVCALMWSNWSS